MRASQTIELKRWIIHHLRRISLYWPPKNEVIKRNKTTVEIGKTKKGLPKYRVFFRCEKCQTLLTRKEIKLDHINPVIAVSGFVSWDDFMNSLFCDESGFQLLCKSCHDAKTNQETKQRTKNKKLKK